MLLASDESGGRADHVEEVCPVCDGSGAVDGLPCGLCGADGLVDLDTLDSWESGEFEELL